MCSVCTSCVTACSQLCFRPQRSFGAFHSLICILCLYLSVGPFDLSPCDSLSSPPLPPCPVSTTFILYPFLVYFIPCIASLILFSFPLHLPHPLYFSLSEALPSFHYIYPILCFSLSPALPSDRSTDPSSCHTYLIPYIVTSLILLSIPSTSAFVLVLLPRLRYFPLIAIFIIYPFRTT